MLSGGRGPSAVLTLTLSSIECSQRAAGPGGTGASEPLQLLPVILLQRGGEFPAWLTSRASQQCCSEIHLIVNCSCSTAPLHAPAPWLVRNQSLLWFLAVVAFAVPVLEASRSTVFCTPSCHAHQGQMPTRKRSSRENFLFAIQCFQACQFS